MGTYGLVPASVVVKEGPQRGRIKRVAGWAEEMFFVLASEEVVTLSDLVRACRSCWRTGRQTRTRVRL